MSFWDSISSALGTVGDVLGSGAVQGGLSLAAGGLDLYQGLQAMGQQQKMSNLAQRAAEQQMAAATMSMDDYKKLYRPLQKKQAEAALEDWEKMRGLGQAQRDYGIERGLYDIERAKSFYRPLEESVVTELAEGVDPQEYMNRASADIQRGFTSARQAQSREAMRAGLSPSSGRFASILAGQGTQQALAEAGARTQARRGAEDLSLARKAQALNYASGIPITTIPQMQQGTIGSAISGLGAAAGQSAAQAATLGQQAQQNLAGSAYGFSNASDYWSGK